MTALVSFSTTVSDVKFPDTELRQLRLERSAYRFAGIDRHHKWTRKKLKRTSFYKQHKQVLDLIPGAGYFLWKPYIIHDALLQAKNHDWILYCDNSLFFIKDATILFELAAQRNGFGLFSYADNYTIKNIMQPATCSKLQISNDLLNSSATWSGLILLQKNPDTLNFVEEWFRLCRDPELLVDQPPFPPGVVHKQDMPLLSYVRSLYGIEGLRIPHQYGDKNKMEPFRKDTDFLMDGDYENQVFTNSPYDTLCTWDKDGVGCRRPWSHYVNPAKMIGFLRRKIA